MTWIKRGSEKTVEEVFLRNIGVNSTADVNAWFQKSYDDKYRIERMTEAVNFSCMYKDKTVSIIGDYDADGITSTSILYLALKRAGFKDVRMYIPKRFSEGYGINMTIIDKISSGLIITCDNGISQTEQVNAAKEKGLGVIILDHHQPLVIDGDIVLPDADVIIDPNAIPNSADFNGYCGAGLCYKFAKALLPGDEHKGFHNVLLGLAAIGTVADVMELREENYVFVRNGLKRLVRSDCCTTGTYALISALDLSKHLDAKDIGFKIGPTINASSRMKDDGAMDVVELLTYQGPFQEAVKKAERLIEVNERRKKVKKEGIERAEKVIESECLYGDVPLVVYIPEIGEGIIGIIAGNLCEKYKVPTVVLTSTETGDILKGSARSCGNYNIKEQLDNVSDLLEAYGGHEGAAGLSLKKENLDGFRAAITAISGDFEYESLDVQYYDLEIEASDIAQYINQLEKYAPFGEGNPAPVFKITGFSVVPRYGSYFKTVADTGVKLFNADTTAVGFDMIDRFKEPYKLLDFVGTLSDNYFMGSITHQIEFSDFKPQEVNKTVTPLAAKLASMALATNS